MRVLVMDGTLEAYIVKRELIVVLGQQGEGKGSFKNDKRRWMKSNVRKYRVIWCLPHPWWRHNPATILTLPFT